MWDHGVRLAGVVDSARYAELAEKAFAEGITGDDLKKLTRADKVNANPTLAAHTKVEQVHQQAKPVSAKIRHACEAVHPGGGRAGNRRPGLPTTVVEEGPSAAGVPRGAHSMCRRRKAIGSGIDSRTAKAIKTGHKIEVRSDDGLVEQSLRASSMAGPSAKTLTTTKIMSSTPTL